jgi:hypothetical protein
MAQVVACLFSRSEATELNIQYHHQKKKKKFSTLLAVFVLLPLTSSVTAGKLLRVSVPPCSNLRHRDNRIYRASEINKLLYKRACDKRILKQWQNRMLWESMSPYLDKNCTAEYV